jgi:cell division transport system permease protein
MGSFKYFLNEASASLLRGWRSAILAVLTIAAGMFVLGFFLILNTNVQHLVNRWTQAAELSVYLKDDATPQQLQVIDDLVEKSGLAARREFVSKQDAAKRFGEDFPDLATAARGLNRNPFPASFEVRLAEPASDATGPALDGLATALASAPGVADVRYDRRWLNRLTAAIRFARGVGLLVIVMLAVAASLTVANVVRLAANARRDEIEIMQLVGAPLGYIRGPFVTEGVLQGGVGALAALALLWGIFLVARARYGAIAAEALGLETLTFLPVELCLLLLAGGMLLGCLGGFAVARSVK